MQCVSPKSCWYLEQCFYPVWECGWYHHRETPWKRSVRALWHAERHYLVQDVCTRELRGTWEGFYRSCKLPSILFSVSKAGVGVSMRVEASTSSCGSYSQTPTEPAFPDAEPSWTHGGTRCLEKGRRLSENIVQEGFKISSKSARITARDSEPERFCRDFCSLRNYVREEQDDVGPTPPGDDRRV